MGNLVQSPLSRQLVPHGRAARMVSSANGTVSMPVEIARANIAHFKKLLETEADEKKRGALQRQLADEEQKLAAAIKARNEKK
jgi:hypothetical protein